LFPRLADGSSPFETLNTGPPSQASRPPPAPPLPLFVEPILGEEALLSWILRLASAFGVSLQTLVSESFGIEACREDSRWWRYPHPSLLARIAQRTGVHIADVRRMTSDGLEPAYRDDEASDRFTGRWFHSAPPSEHDHPFGVCGLCLEGDPEPGVRTLWLIGWMALCPRHGIRLLTQCPDCGARLRFPRFDMPAAFSPSTCRRCGKSLLDGHYRLAHPAATRLQAVLLKAKKQGFADFSDLGRLTWKEAITLIDVLLGMIWTDATSKERNRIFRQMRSDLGINKVTAVEELRRSRHEGLCLIAWLLSGWPRSRAAQIASDMLERSRRDMRDRTAQTLRPRRFGPWVPQ